MTAPAHDVILGYVVLETCFDDDGQPSGTDVFWSARGLLLATEEAAGRERKRAQDHANLDADLNPGEKRGYGVAVVKSP